MKFHLIAATLAVAFTASYLSADELKASAPASSRRAAESAPAAVASAPAAKTASGVAAKPRRSYASEPGRKIATDYAPAQDLLLSAMSLIGVKYKWGGNTPESGLDCSGFVRYVFQNSLNIMLPRTALNMSRQGDNIDKDELKPGDLVFFNTLRRKFSHVGIYLGDNRFIHAPRTGRTIEIANMGDRYWTTRFNGARRVSELDHETVDIEALLQGRPARKPAVSATSSRSCRKVVTRKNGKKITRTVCAQGASKPAHAKSRKKASGTASKPANKKAASKKNKKSKKKKKAA